MPTGAAAAASSCPLMRWPALLSGLVLLVLAASILLLRGRLRRWQVWQVTTKQTEIYRLNMCFLEAVFLFL